VYVTNIFDLIYICSFRNCFLSSKHGNEGILIADQKVVGLQMSGLLGVVGAESGAASRGLRTIVFIPVQKWSRQNTRHIQMTCPKTGTNQSGENKKNAHPQKRTEEQARTKAGGHNRFK
jgi:hypothetical protein